jgi:Domain of unknown function (DUF4198)
MQSRRFVVAMVVSMLCVAAQAHDSWFAPQPSPRAADVRLALGTGNRFPKLETSVGAGALAEHGCRHGEGPRAPLRIVRDTPVALQLRSSPVTRQTLRAGHGAITCWAQLVPFEVEIAPATVELYFKEINPPAAVREAWREMQSRGVGWKERYTKNVRWERHDTRLGLAEPPPASPTPMGLDIVLEGTLKAPVVGETLTFRVLRDGQPLAGLAVELQSSLTARGFWTQTDAEGRANVRLPFAGAYLLRGVDLRLSTNKPDTWDSRFVMLAFEARPAP